MDSAPDLDQIKELHITDKNKEEGLNTFSFNTDNKNDQLFKNLETITINANSFDLNEDTFYIAEHSKATTIIITNLNELTNEELLNLSILKMPNLEKIYLISTEQYRPNANYLTYTDYKTQNNDISVQTTDFHLTLEKKNELVNVFYEEENDQEN